MRRHLVLAVAAALAMAAVPAAARAGMSHREYVTFQYTGHARQYCFACVGGAGATNNGVNYVNGRGTALYEYEWHMFGQATVTVDASGRVQDVDRERWISASGTGEENINPNINCVDIGVAVFGQPPTGQCDPRPLEDDTQISMYRPWAGHPEGGLPAFDDVHGRLVMDLVSPLNDSAIEDHGIFEGDAHPSVVNASTDWLFPVWPADPTVQRCVWKHAKLDRRWGEINRPTVTLGTREPVRFDMTVPLTRIPAGGCAPGTWQYVGQGEYDEMQVSSQVTLHAES